MWFNWKNPPKKTVHVYDVMTIVRSAASQKTWGDLSRLILKCFTPGRVDSPSEVHIVFDIQTDNQAFCTKQTKQVSQAAGKGKRSNIGNVSQEMSQGNDYKVFLKNSLKRQILWDDSRNSCNRGYHVSTWITGLW